jgi:hypothetical protein
LYLPPTKKFGSEAWVLKKREEQRLEAAEMKFLRHLLGIKNYIKKKNHCIRGKYGSTEYSKGNKTVPGKVATTRRGWTQTEWENKRYNINQKVERT